ncbi:alcohol dehydrogenase [Tistlia consotensis]|uniref:Alcohol dehydrogenase n=1 Tax=Tistlia consotensis USBA 355 TaxID=560819 RepID=A0A1Y6B7P8_9PROT|nr:medium chain dehydrogenase/reductase family protein [Tistlia consotensis]SME88638.1 alcohol dehydrogenase [Tistlia consotensis USBA 355]SNR25164.1 alcohol dehydrogenase [Tistlia consotensis]
MRAAVLREFGAALSVETLPDPVAAPGEAAVEVIAVPVLSYADEVFANVRPHGLRLPVVPGCGAIGRVIEAGPDATRLEPGDWVYCDPTIRSRDAAQAPDILLHGWAAPSAGAQRLHGHFHDGAFAERMRVPLENAFALGAIDEERAAAWCALGSFLVPYGGLLAGGLQPGQTALVSGATGHFGSAAVALALAMGAARVIAPGRNAERLAELRDRFGRRVRTVALSGDEEADRSHLQEAGDRAIDCVLDILPPLPDAAPVRAAALSVRPGGTIVLMGGSDVGLELPYRQLMRNDITLRGQWMYPRAAVPRLIALVRAGLVPLEAFSVTRFSLAQVNDAVADAAAEAGPFRLSVIEPRRP